MLSIVKNALDGVLVFYNVLSEITRVLKSGPTCAINGRLPNGERPDPFLVIIQDPFRGHFSLMYLGFKTSTLYPSPEVLMYLG